jgi:hypothetical protein
MGLMAIDQDEENKIGDDLRKLAHEFLQPARLTLLGKLPKLEEPWRTKVVHLAKLTAIMRGHVVRNSHGGREIIDGPFIEEIGRLSKVLARLMASHARLWDRPPEKDDLRIARRVALDTIPNNRRRLLEHIPDHASITRGEIVKDTGIPPTTALWVGEELQALGVVNLTQDTLGEFSFKFTDKFQNLKDKTFENALV